MENKVSKKIHPGNLVLLILALGILVMAAFYFLNYLFRKQRYLQTNDAQVECYINPVSARAGGYIKQVRFEEHQSVKQGDTLVIIDDREYVQRLKEARAAVEDARASIAVLAAGIASAETGTLVNQDQIDGAKARLTQQEQDIKRYQNLISEEATTGSDLDQVRSHYEVALSDYNAARNSLKTSYAKIRELRSRKALLLADLERKGAELQLARINLSYTVIRAPYTGKLGRKTILEGQQVQPGQPLVFIVDEKDKWITANFKEEQVYRMHVGQAVDIRVDAIDDRLYQGRIEAIAASTGAKFSLLPPDNATGNFVKIVQRVPVKIRFTSRDIGPVKAGMNVLVSVKKQNP